MKKLNLSVMLAALMAFSGNVFADSYSTPAVVPEITVGSTGNWYFYPARGVGKTFDLSYTVKGGPVMPAYTHFIHNPAGCASPSRYVLDSTAGNYDEVIEALKIFGGSSLGNFASTPVLKGGYQFYISSTSCTANSPKIVRIRNIPMVLAPLS